MRHTVSSLTAGLIGVMLVGSLSVAAAGQQDGPWQTYGTENGEWRSYGGNIASQKYSPLDQVDAGNFGDLEIAWRWRSVDAMVSRTMPDGSEWWAPLDDIVASLVEDTPNLYRSGHLPRAGWHGGHATHGRRRALLQHGAVAGCGGRCDDG